MNIMIDISMVDTHRVVFVYDNLSLHHTLVADVAAPFKVYSSSRPPLRYTLPNNLKTMLFQYVFFVIFKIFKQTTLIDKQTILQIQHKINTHISFLIPCLAPCCPSISFSSLSSLYSIFVNIFQS